ncbi:MAG: HAMP domain-containing protein, partial [Rubrivivax sp.]|nr:HAMP domain-containing protein [Rubrivivax sp.]
MDEANTDMVTRIDRSTTMTVRAARRADNYVASAFQLAAETTEAGNVRYREQAAANETQYKSRMAQVLKDMPEKASVIEPVLSSFQKAFATCNPVIEAASRTTSSDDAQKAAARLKVECVPLIESALAAQTRLVDGLIADATKMADQMTVDANSSIRSIFVASGVGLLAGLAMALFIGIKGLARPIRDLLEAMAALARNDLKAIVPGIARRDEVGDMARNVEVFKTNAIEVERLKAQLVVSEQQAAISQKAAMKKLADDFEGAVGEIIETVSSASTELEASAGTLTATAVRSQELTTAVAAASEEASTNVQSVASATEEMASSVNEISRQVQESARIAGDAVGQARKTNDRVSELSKAAARIGDVVELINTIA